MGYRLSSGTPLGRQEGASSERVGPSIELRACLTRAASFQ